MQELITHPDAVGADRFAAGPPDKDITSGLAMGCWAKKIKQLLQVSFT